MALHDVLALDEVTLALKLDQLTLESEYRLLVTSDLFLEADDFNG